MDFEGKHARPLWKMLTVACILLALLPISSALLDIVLFPAHENQYKYVVLIETSLGRQLC